MERHLHLQLFSQVSLVNYHPFFVLLHRGGGGGVGRERGKFGIDADGRTPALTAFLKSHSGKLFGCCVR